MKFRCERDDLLGAVQFASRAISNRATLPVLSGLRIEAKEAGWIGVAATDLELTMQTAFQAGVDEPGLEVVPGRLFNEIVRNLGSGQVSLASAEGELEIASGRGHFRVRTLMPDDYPALPVEESAADSISVEMDSGALAGSLAQVVRSASSDESRQVLTGVLWEIGPGRLTLAATDSYRLAVSEVEVEGGPGEAVKVILPARALAELGRALQGTGGRVRTLVRDNLVTFFLATGGQEGSGGGQSVIATRFIEGEFPNYRRLLPDGYPNALTVDRESLLETVKRVGLLAQNNLPVKLRLAGELEVSAHTPDVGEGQEVVDAEYQGEPFVIAFNPQFLHEGASAIRTERVVLEAGDGLKPALLKGEDETSFTYLLMPVRLS
ncbi:MAG: DNA polymerase III subunit beta [Actinobacteria bacterium]|nr:DNA polymerase III subunit beta [Actinomycetota bacterium]MDQ3531637.1 DNA polymerase III subunit beta [Actinomycetota bacterium]